MPAIAGDQCVIGELSCRPEFGNDGCARLGEIRHPYLAGIVQREYEPPARGIDQPDCFGQLAVSAIPGRNVGNQLQRCRIEHLDAAGLVIGHGDQRAVIGNRAADGVAGLHHPLGNAALQQVELGQAAVAAEDVGITLIG